MDPAVYFLTYGNNLNRPEYPGPTPVYPIGINNIQHQQAQDNHQRDLMYFDTVQLTKSLLLSQIANAIEHKYLSRHLQSRRRIHRRYSPTSIHLFTKHHYQDAYKEGVCEPQANRTFQGLRDIFNAEYALQNELNLTTSHAGYNSATITVQDNVNVQSAIQDLAEATVADRTAFSELSHQQDEIHTAMQAMTLQNEQLKAHMQNQQY
mmetsp:Transcript_6045/g.9238  ORF Transcript_6045/g.9238 Transcript_6045/m.9238 type:complete len:207 (-) Transcript_6045:1541-2161(-)